MKEKSFWRIVYDFYITRFLVLILGYILGGILGYIGAHFSIKLNKSKE